MYANVDFLTAKWLFRGAKFNSPGSAQARILVRVVRNSIDVHAISVWDWLYQDKKTKTEQFKKSKKCQETQLDKAISYSMSLKQLPTTKKNYG